MCLQEQELRKKSKPLIELVSKQYAINMTMSKEYLIKIVVKPKPPWLPIKVYYWILSKVLILGEFESYSKLEV